MFKALRASLGALLLFGGLAAASAASAAPIHPFVYAPPGGVFTRAAPAARAMPARIHLNPIYKRQLIRWDSGEAPGTIIVDTAHHFLYLQLEGGRSLRYGVGTARPGFGWHGTHRIIQKREWPDWTPPAAMLKRQPGIPRHMEGGIDNPLGARALYIGNTLYRIHGTNQPWTIGQDISSGCIRMLNEDVIDLYERVKIGAKVIVL